MTRFSECLSVVLVNEGGLSNHKNDRGGKTNYGITQSTFSAWLKFAGLIDRDVSEIHEHEVEAIYYSMYWKDAHCDYLGKPVDLQVFDASVNHGPNRAIKLLQRVLGVDEDGVCGRETLRALHEEAICRGLEWVANQYLDERRAFYDRIIANDPSQSVFAGGWSARVIHLREYV